MSKISCEKKVEDSMWILQASVFISSAVAVILFVSETFF